MAYIGRDVTYGVFSKQTLTGMNGSTQNWDLDFQSIPAEALIVVYDNVIQEPLVAYTCTTTQIQFTSAPVTGSSLYLIYMGRSLTQLVQIPNIAGQSHGDLMYYNGTAWVRLAAGTSGYSLTTNGSGASPTWSAAEDAAAMALALGG